MYFSLNELDLPFRTEMGKMIAERMEKKTEGEKEARQKMGEEAKPGCEYR